MSGSEAIEKLLASYPRNRPKLPAPQARIYIEEYKINRGVQGGALYRTTAALEAWMHRRVAGAGGGRRVLELGAGTLNHLPYEGPSDIYDVVEPSAELLAAAEQKSRVNHVFTSIDAVPTEIGYDRIFSIAVLEHLEDLPHIVGACGLRLAPCGIFQAGIPAEGGLLWGLAWRATTGVAYRLRNGLDYGAVMRHEHVNAADDILAVLRHYFAEVKVSWFPLPFRHLAFYGYIEASQPDLQRCRAAHAAAAG